MPSSVAEQDRALAEWCRDCADDPLRFVLEGFPWMEPGPLERGTICDDGVERWGPDENQKEFLEAFGKEIRLRGFDGMRPVIPILMNETSGHGTGKSALGGWIAAFILSTRADSVGTVTAGTAQQLEERTWAAVQHWMALCITARWFDIMASGIFHKDPKHANIWKLVHQTCKEENAQSFAGQHAKGSTSWYLLDEASEVPDGVWITLYGGLTSGEDMVFAWGQPVRNTGEFYRVCFGDKATRWNGRRVDSRTSRFTNKELIAQWIADYGIDSDYVKVRVLGLPPSASELQYIDKHRVDAALAREQTALADDPLIAGFDVSGGGKAWNVIRFRRGLVGDALPPIRIPGEHDPERNQRVGICAELLSDRRPGHQIAMLFIDSAFGAPIAVRLKAMGFTNVQEINFGGDSPDVHCLNMRAYMYMKAKEWLLLGSIPKGEEKLGPQLCLPGYHTNNRGKLVMEAKAEIAARGEVSPDDADAFVLTFAQAVAPKKPVPVAYRPKSSWS